ncbi:Y_Y_Y domain-containing protein [Tenacibaculum sp. MAR_2009_124]|uniref:sensor histidine kinase n=1 Tax=Tenacibaculum sp. MAR_2009_124 TaxID=1250059 RepID=UPI000894A4CC|nr:histidine kinase [Tenacibaculum sp. MAR_2009_124]SED16973.1 Y_Y_Y domain-containing protein [Tenacibaculum sp. MAR_2009_124]
MRLQKYQSTLLLLLIWGFSYAQQYTNFSVENGLPSNHVYRITQDYEGFIWFITDKGMVKYDGKTFKTFTTKNGLPTNDIWNIRITPDNKVWYFSKSNKLGYIKNDSVYAFATKTNKTLYPRAIFQVKNKVGFNDGIFHYTLKDSLWKATKNLISNNERYSKQKVIHPTIRFHSVGKKGNNIVFYKEKNKKIFPIEKEILETTSENGQINDSLYISIAKQHYVIENFNSEKIHTHTYASQNLPRNLKYFRFHNVNNHIQLTGMNFVSYLDVNGRLKNTVSIPEKRNSHFSFVDKTGNIWSATFNKGVFMLPKEKQQLQILGEGKKIQQLKYIEDKIYAGVYKEGFFILEDNNLRSLIKNSGFQYGINYIDTLKTTFFSSEYDVYSYKNKTIKKVKVSTPKYEHFKNEFARKLIGFKGVLYGNNSFGVHKINSKNFIVEKEYKLFGVSSFSKTNTQLFIGNQSGLYSLQNDVFFKLEKHSLFQKPILFQTQFNNNYTVVGTDGFGAYFTDGKEVMFIDNSENLSVQNIFINTDKSVWLATEKGVHKAIKQENGYQITQSFFETDGLLSNKTNSVTVKNDSLFVATDIGVSVISLRRKPINQLQKLYIKALTASGISYKGDTISFPYKENSSLNISFGAVNYSNQKNLRYQYKLNPIQKKWIHTNTSEINFSQLAPKTYRLHLKVSNHKQQSITKVITLIVLPLWYQTYWFKGTAFFVFLVFLYFLYQWNKKRIEEKSKQEVKVKQQLVEQELYALRSQMNPHFVFNSLNAIQYYITKNEIDLSEKYLVKFSKLIRMFFDFSAEKTITLQQEIDLLNGYLEIEKMRFGDGLNYQFIIDKSINLKTSIPTMLLQPILENAVNHGVFHNNRKGNIIIYIENITKNEFKITIEDDGVGFKKAQEIKENSIKKHTSKSTKIMKDRIALINQSKKWKVVKKIVHLNNNKITGTSVTLTFKML